MAPSPVRVNELPEPRVQLVPELSEYSNPAVDSKPVTLILPSLVILSRALTPVSVFKARVGITGATVSKVKRNSLVAPRLPAASVCLMNNDLAPSFLNAKVKSFGPGDQFTPLLSENSQVALASIPETVTMPAKVTLSVALIPVSLARTTTGAKGRKVSTLITGARVATEPKLLAESL